MFKYIVFAAGAAILVLASVSQPHYIAGTWQIDEHHSDAQLITDATTNFGKTKMDTTLGFARISGVIRFDEANSARSSVDLEIYPATSMQPAMDEYGKFRDQWLAKLANNTLVCFHSKGISRRPDGRLQTTGTLVLTRVDRNVEVNPNEGYAGPIYGAPMIHRVTRETALVLNPVATDAKDRSDGAIAVSGSTSMFREDFPQLVQAVVSTHWPVVVQDENCKTPLQAGKDYRGGQCTGVFLQAPPLPQVPQSGPGEDYPAPSNFNTVVGNRMRLTPRRTAAQPGD